MNYEFLLPVEEEKNKICKDSENNHIAVVLGWYPLKPFLVKYPLEKKLYGVAGNLYNSSIGVKTFIGNILNNPQITDVIVCDLTPEDSMQGKPGEKLISAMEKHPTLKDSVKVTKVINLEELEKALKDCRNPFQGVKRERVVTEIEEVLHAINPTFPIGQIVSEDTIESAHIELVRRIRINGVIEKNVQELLSLQTCILKDPYNSIEYMENHQDSDLRDYCLGILYGSDYLDNKYKGKIKANYHYGDRIISHFGFNQSEKIIEKFLIEPETKSGLITLFEPNDLIKGGSPCLTQIWVRLRHGELHLFGNFRSNDMYRAWVKNAYLLRTLQVYMAEKLGVEVGILTTISMSAHIYDVCYAEIDNFLKENKVKKKPYNSFEGNFIITWNGETKEVDCTQLEEKGNFQKKYSNKKIKPLMLEILKNNPNLANDHASYLATEITLCFSMKEDYIQDIFGM